MPPDEALRPAVARAFSRALVLVLGLTVAELGVRAAASAVRFPDTATAGFEALAHAGQLAPLIPLIALLHLLGAAIRSTRVGGWMLRPVEGAFVLLSAPSRALRVAVCWMAAWLALSATAGASTQLPYHAGAVYATPVLVLAAGVEVLVARSRPGRVSLRPSTIGVGLWMVGLVLLSTVFASRVALSLAGAGVTAVLLLAWLAVGLRPGAGRGQLVAFGYGVLLLGVVVDIRNPALRRFASAHATYAALGRAVAAWATDLDGDGSSATFGLDCDDLDPLRAPRATDLPDDGIDQNCRVGDATLERALARYEPGGVHHLQAADTVLSSGRSPRDVFLVTLDAARADLFDRGDLLPETLAFASRCIRFTHARAAAPATGESMVALHTGMFARHVVTDDGEWFIDLARPDQGKMSIPPTLAASLAIVAAYRTAAVLPSFHSENFSFLTGYVGGGTLPDPDPRSAASPPATVVLDAARKHHERPSPGVPVHVRAHLMDLHAPYLGGSSREAYDRSARSLDGPLATYLRELPGSAIIVLTADHGEAFGEHGHREHGHTLFDEELRVPLVLCAPPELGLGAPRTIDVPVSLADVTPTLLDVLGVVVPYRRHGTSLVPLLTGRRERSPPWVFFENLSQGQMGVLLGCDKWLEDSRVGFRVLFDICEDPGELEDLAQSEPARAARMERLVGEIADLDLDAFRTWRLGRLP